MPGSYSLVDKVACDLTEYSRFRRVSGSSGLILRSFLPFQADSSCTAQAYVYKYKTAFEIHATGLLISVSSAGSKHVIVQQFIK
jgi:hypothetical protein